MCICVYACMHARTYVNYHHMTHDVLVFLYLFKWYPFELWYQSFDSIPLYNQANSSKGKLNIKLIDPTINLVNTLIYFINVIILDNLILIRTFQNGHLSEPTFIDLKSAYNSVWKNGLIMNAIVITTTSVFINNKYIIK